VARIEKVAEKILQVIFEDSSQKIANSVDMIGGHERGTVCCVYKHCSENMSGQCGNSLKYDVIRMVIRGNQNSHCLCLHLCDGSSEFQVYSKKGCLSFFPEKGALVIAAGDQTQVHLHFHISQCFVSAHYWNKENELNLPNIDKFLCKGRS